MKEFIKSESEPAPTMKELIKLKVKESLKTGKLPLEFKFGESDFFLGRKLPEGMQAVIYYLHEEDQYVIYAPSDDERAGT